MKGVWAIAVRTLLLLLSLATVDVCAGNFDPLAADPAFLPAHVDLTVHDAARNRDIPAVLNQAFTDLNHHCVILALCTAFWDAYLRGDAGALAWLNDAGPRSVMELDDGWQSSAH